jgi:excisionase family DNA binding protein
MPLLLSPEQCADSLGVGRTFVYTLLASGQIESLKLGRRRLVPEEALKRFIESERERQLAETGT